METAMICFILLTAISGLTEGDGVLPDDRLDKAAGDKVVFTTTLTLTEKSFVFVSWNFGDQNILTSYADGSNVTVEVYKGRITLFSSTGSLELRSLTMNDTGEYRIRIVDVVGAAQTGRTSLKIHERVSGATVTPNTTDLVEFNSSVSLVCSASGSSLSFLWLNGSSVVTESDRVHLTDGGSSLTILHVTRYDKGPYRCLASNPVSTDTSAPVELSISFSPGNVSGCSAGCIVGIVIACLIVVMGAAVGGYYIYKKKPNKKPTIKSTDLGENVYENDSVYENVIHTR